MKKLALYLSIVEIVVGGLGLGAQAATAKDVRKTANGSIVVRSNHWKRVPHRICDGKLWSNAEAWSVKAGKRVGDDKLSFTAEPFGVYNGYRGKVRVYFWCDSDFDSVA